MEYISIDKADTLPIIYYFKLSVSFISGNENDKIST